MWSSYVNQASLLQSFGPMEGGHAEWGDLCRVGESSHLRTEAVQPPSEIGLQMWLTYILTDLQLYG